MKKPKTMKQLLLFSGLLAWMFPAALLAQPYNVDWEDLTRMTVSGADLTSTSGGAMARSAFVLPSFTDGYVEFDAGTVNHSIYLGFGEHPNYTLDKDDIEFGVKLNADDQIFSWESGTETLLGSFVSTDVIRVERIGSKVYYKKNGTTLSSSTVSTGKPWDFSVYSTNSGETITDIQSDFNSYPVNASFVITNEDYTNNSSGAIDMTVSGASGPYTYAWSTSATTEDITGLGAGIYTVTITDGSAKTYTHKVSVGYTPEWMDLVKMNQTGSTLSSTWGFYSSATSTNILWENEDGWVEFTLPSGTYTNYSFGLTEYPNNDYTYFDINYGFNLLSNGLCRVAELNTYTNITSYNSDDVFRIERIGSTIYYYRNGVEVRSLSVDPTEKLVVDFCTKQTGATLSAVRTSYDKKAPQITYSITPETSANQSAGAIDITVTGNTDPYTYNWTPGNITTEDLSNLAGGNYQLSLTDNASRVYTTEAGAGYEISWTGLVNATANGGSVTLNASNYGGVAYSEQSLGANQDGWVEYTIVNNNVPNDFIGFSVAPNTTGSYVNMDYALNFTQNGATYYQAGFGLKTLSPYAVGDIFRVERQGNTIYFKRNGKTLQTKTVDPTEELVVDVASKTNGREFGTIRASFGEAPEIQAVVTHITPFSQGSIDLNIAGGTAPFTVWWDGETYPSQGDFDLEKSQFGLEGLTYGEYLSALSRLSRYGLSTGSYEVSVTDGVGHNLTASIDVGYALGWQAQSGISIANGTITKSAADGWTDGTATALNILEANTDGGLSFSVNQANTLLAVGLKLSSTTLVSGYSDLEYAIVLDNGQIDIWESGSLISNVGSYNAGDQFHIARSGTTMEYRQNGSVLRSVGVSANEELELSTDIYTSLAQVLTLSGNGMKFEPTVSYAVIPASCGDADGSIQLTLSYPASVSNLTFDWKDDQGTTVATTQNLSNHAPGAYTVTISYSTSLNYTPTPIVATLDIPVKMDWASKVNTKTQASPNVNSLYKFQGGNGVLNAYGESKNMLKPNDNGWAGFTIDFLPGQPYHVLSGLKNASTGQIDHSFQVIKGTLLGNLMVIAPQIIGGNNKLVTVQDNDVVRLERQGAQLIYKVNGNQVHSHSLAAGPYDAKRFYVSIADEQIVAVAAGSNFECFEGATVQSYNRPDRHLHGQLLETYQGKLKVQYHGRYNAGTLIYNIYDEGHQVVSSNSLNPTANPSTKVKGDNRFEFDLAAANLANGVYTLEIVDEHNEKYYLRFRKFY